MRSWSIGALVAGLVLTLLPIATHAGMTPRETKIFESYKVLAEAGDDEAQSELGFCYSAGIGVAPDELESLKWNRKAAEQGNPKAIYVLGSCYEAGDGALKQDLVEAYAYYMLSGLMNMRVMRVPVIFDKLLVGERLALAQKRAKSSELALNLIRYSLGNLSNRLSKEEIATGQKRALELMAKISGSIPGEAKLLNEIKILAEKGDSDAQHAMALCFSEGIGVATNSEQAISWHLKAAQQSHSGSQFLLGLRYFNGDGVRKDRAVAVSWFRKAADRGHLDAQVELGLCLADGAGVLKNSDEAASWYRKSAVGGNARAQYNLGLCFLSGDGVEKNGEEAVLWFRKAAEQNYVSAQYNLGLCYYHGFGVPKDDVEAYAYFKLIAEPDRDVQNNISVLEKKLTSEEIRAGRKRAVDLRKDVVSKMAAKSVGR